MESDLEYKTNDPYSPRLLPDGRVASRLTSFVIRGTRIKPHLAQVMRNYGQHFEILVPRGAGEQTVADTWNPDLQAIFPARNRNSNRPLVLEIGSGMGDQAVSWAKSNLHSDLLALEVWDEGRAQTIKKAVCNSVLENLRLMQVDATLLIERFEPNTFAEIWTFFPDPWRKSRHHRRRLIQPGFSRQVWRVLKPGGKWRIATDWEEYATHIDEVLSTSQPAWQVCDETLESQENQKNLGNPPVASAQSKAKNSGGKDYEYNFQVARWPGRVLTKFEKKGLKAGRKIVDFCAMKSMGGKDEAEIHT